MSISGKAKFVRAFAAISAALALFSVPGKNIVSVPDQSAVQFLDLLPNIAKGLDLVAYTAPPVEPPVLPEPDLRQSEFTVWNGSEAVKMNLTDYIIGVTAAEMPASYEPEALKAQAVAARTFTLKHINGELRCKSGYALCTDPGCCQAFMTIGQMKKNWGGDFEKYYNKIRAAVVSTEGQVLMSGGELVTALYHSSSGGRTENCEAVFAVALPYLVSVESAGEEDSPEYKAVKTYSNAEFIRIINEKFPDAELTDPKNDVEVWQRTESGRIALIRLGGTVRTGQQLRNALGLHSTNAEFGFADDAVTITCYGFGHGVGMSQCGANAMAKQGADYAQILKHYYTGVEIVRVPSETELWVAGR